MTINFDKLKFRPKDKIGEGFFGSVYKVTDGINYDNRYVAKVFHQPKILSALNELTYGVSFKKEVDALRYLGDLNISPKVFDIHDSYNIRYYIMESMDVTLQKILIEDYFTRDHLEKLNLLLLRITKTNIRHNDLHTNNIMWSNKLNDFRIIDWGMYDIVDRSNKTNIQTNKTISKMMRSGDMYKIIQLYVAYRLKEGDNYTYWKKDLDDFLKYIPKKENIYKKYSKKTLNNKATNGIEKYINKKNNITSKKSRIRTSKKFKNSNKLRLREAEKLLSKKTNTGFYELNNL